jgi:hypothetical protein
MGIIIKSLKLQLSPKARVIQAIEVQNQDSNSKFQVLFFKVKSGLTPERKFVPDDLFYKCANLQKLLKSTSIYFNGSNRAIQLSFQT